MEWIKEEHKELVEKEKSFVEGIKFVENTPIPIEIDFSKPFEKWYDSVNKTTKKIIPVIHEGINKNWWLNVANPTYKEVIQLGVAGVNKISVMRTGQGKNTRYILIHPDQKTLIEEKIPKPKEELVI